MYSASQVASHGCDCNKQIGNDAKDTRDGNYGSLDECLNVQLPYTKYECRVRGRSIKRKRSEEPLLPIAFVSIKTKTTKDLCPRLMRVLLGNGASGRLASDETLKRL